MNQINSQRSEHASQVRGRPRKISLRSARTSGNYAFAQSQDRQRSWWEPSVADGKPEGGERERVKQSTFYDRYRACHFTARWNRRNEAYESGGPRLGAGRRQAYPTGKHLLVRRLGT